MLGVRSTSLQSWISRKTPAWRQLCRKDKRHGVNASVWGTLKMGRRRFVQVGEGRKFQFCKSASHAAAGDAGHRLLHAARGDVFRWRQWRRSPRRQRQQRPSRTSTDLMQQLPSSGRLSVHDHGSRLHPAPQSCAAQSATTSWRRHLPSTAAVARSCRVSPLRRCSAIEGRNHYFRRRRSGAVKDPFHPDKRATGRFLTLRRQALCRALRQQFAKSSPLPRKARVEQRDDARSRPTAITVVE